jgi:hypothetical protein
MTVRDENERRIAVTVTANASSTFDELVRFVLG